MTTNSKDGSPTDWGENKGQKEGAEPGAGPCGIGGKQSMRTLPGTGKFLASVVACLRGAGRNEEGRLVAACSLETVRLRRIPGKRTVDVALVGPVEVLRRLTTTDCFQPEGMVWVRKAVRLCLPSGYRLGTLRPSVAPVNGHQKVRAKKATGEVPGVGGARPVSNKAGASGGHSEGKEAPGSRPGEGLREAEELPVARRVFGILERLRMEATVRKAPLVEVFHLAVMEGMSGKGMARRCKCAASLISARVTALEDRFGMTVEKLRALATHIREIESAVKGRRTEAAPED